MTTLRRVITGTALLALASGLALANTIDAVETATGSVPSFSAPPNPNTSSTTVGGFSEAAANAAIALACPVGFSCSTATLYEIDLGLSANTAGNLTISNSNSTTQNVGCFAATCSGSTATATNGVAAEGTLSLDVFDPLGNDVLALVNAPTFSVATNGVTGSGAGKSNFLTVNPGANTFAGTGTATDPLGEIYQMSDSMWTTEAADYSVTNVSLSPIHLNGASQIGSSPAGVTTSANTDSITGGTITAKYLYSYTETNTSGVPEPTTMVLLGGALLGLGLIRKRASR